MPLHFDFRNQMSNFLSLLYVLYSYVSIFTDGSARSSREQNAHYCWLLAYVKTFFEDRRLTGYVSKEDSIVVTLLKGGSTYQSGGCSSTLVIFDDRQEKERFCSAVL